MEKHWSEELSSDSESETFENFSFTGYEAYRTTNSELTKPLNKLTLSEEENTPSLDTQEQSKTQSNPSYKVIWEGGDLGIALTTKPTSTNGIIKQDHIVVSRVTNKGQPNGIELVETNDILLSINQFQTASVTLEQVVEHLQVCALPATLVFLRQEKPTEEKEIRTTQKSVMFDVPPSPPVRFTQQSLVIPEAAHQRRSVFDDEVESEEIYSEISDDCILEEPEKSPPKDGDCRLSPKSMENRMSSPVRDLKPSVLRVSNASNVSTATTESALVRRHSLADLHAAAFKGQLQLFRSYLQASEDIQEELLRQDPNHGQTPLHLAVRGGHVDVVRAILQSFRPVENIVNVIDDKGNIALHFAATKTPEIMYYLLKHKARVACENNRKLTPLAVAILTAKKDNSTIVKMLLKYGANPNAMHNLQSILHTAVENGHLKLAGTLIRFGARMDLEDENGTNVFEKVDRKTLRTLLSSIYFPPTFISIKDRSNCMLCIKKLGFGRRSHNCTHCGRICCHDCTSLFIERVRFPKGFPGRVGKGKAVHTEERVCKTCYNVLKEEKKEGKKSTMYSRNFGIEWVEVNPEKLATENEAGRY